jgi:hypothetical protein
MTVTDALFKNADLDVGLAALKTDLCAEGGPQISTMRNYRFAILVYRPSEELRLRQQMRRLSDELKTEGWGVLAISLQKLLLDRIRAMGEANLASLADREKRLYGRDPERALTHLKDRIAPHIEGPNGIAADVIRLITSFADAYPNQADRTVIFIGRAGAIYPFFRSSALLKHIDGKTRNIPVILLYPGERRDTGLSFMGELPADRDYRPRIYP